MEKSPQRTFPFKVSPLHLLILVYCLAMGALVAKIFSEKQRNSVPVSMTRVLSGERPGQGTLLSMQGERMHGKARILYAADMVDDRALLWEVLPGASVRAVAVEDRFALAACYINKLVSLDLSDPGEPVLLDSLEMPGHIREVVMIGSRALVGLARGRGVAVVDISNPDNLQLVNHLPSEGSIVDMVTAGDQVYFADIYRGLGRISLGQEGSLPEILDSTNRPWRLAISEDRLVAASLDGRLIFYSLSRKGVMSRVGATKFPGLEKGGIRGLAFCGENLAVALSDGSLRIFPLSSWPMLQDYSSLTLPGAPYRVIPVPGRNQIAVSLVSSGIALVEIQPSGRAVVSGHLMLPATNVAMDVAGEVLYASRQGGRQGLVAFDIAGIEQSSFSPAIHVDRNYHAFYAWNGGLFGYRRDKSLVLLGDEGHYGSSVSGPILPVLDEDGVSLFRMSADGEVSSAGSIVMQDGALDAVYAEGSLHVLHRDGLTVLSGAQLGEMVVTGELGLSGKPVHLRYLEPGYLLVTTKEDGFKVVDVSDRKRPVMLAHVRPPEHLQSSSIALDILVHDRFAYVSQGSGGLYAIDLGDPRHPELSQILDTPGMARKMVLHDDLLLVADGDEGIYMIDASRPGRLLPVGSLPTPLRVSEMATVGDGILVSNYPGGTLKLPFPERLENYRVVSSRELKGEVPLEKSPGYVYLYDERTHNRARLEPRTMRP